MRRLARVPAAAEPEVLAVVAELARRLDERSADIAREMAFMMAHEIDQLDADAKLLEMPAPACRETSRRSSTYWPTTFRSTISNRLLPQWNTLCVWRSGTFRPTLSFGPTTWAKAI
ncbi:unnamed protein product, partial [Mesorhabditis spiculigera]